MEGEQGSLNGRREVIRGELRRNVMGQLKDQIYLEDEQLYEQIDTAIRQKGKETYLPLKERLWLRNSLYDSFRRLDILQELLDDKDVTEIMINGAGKIFIEKKGNMVLWNRRFEKTEQLEDIIQQIVGKVNRIVNVSSPIADARLQEAPQASDLRLLSCPGCVKISPKPAQPLPGPESRIVPAAAMGSYSLLPNPQPEKPVT